MVKGWQKEVRHIGEIITGLAQVIVKMARDWFGKKDLAQMVKTQEFWHYFAESGQLNSRNSFR